MLGDLSRGRKEGRWCLVNLEACIPADHPVRRLDAVLDLEFVIPAVRSCYGSSGHKGLDPRVIVKMMILLFYFNIPSERELMEQISVRLDFLWFLGLDVGSVIPHHSVLSKARARWGRKLFEQLFAQTVRQCVAAGLVNGSLLHIDSTLVKANASKAGVMETSPELVQVLRQAYQDLEAKLEVVPSADPAQPKACAPEVAETSSPAPVPAPARVPLAVVEPSPSVPESTSSQVAGPAVELKVLPPAPPKPSSSKGPTPSDPTPAVPKPTVNRTHLSLSDVDAELARSKNGVTELLHKEHRIVDDAHGVITAVSVTGANVPDGSQLPSLVEQHHARTGLNLGHLTMAGDHHYGTASNYLFCAQAGIRAHLGEVSANVQERGKLPPSQFIYEPEADRLRCPAGQSLVLHQNRPEEQLKVYQIEDPAQCAQCPLREKCTQSKRGRSVRRHVQAELIAALQQEANSPAGRQSRQRRQHVMEGSFADAANNHGSKKARWRGRWRQQIQSSLIAAVQNLRILIRHGFDHPKKAAQRAAWLAQMVSATGSGLERRCRLSLTGQSWAGSVAPR
jgi:transposase